MVLALPACGDDMDPEGARSLWGRLTAEGFRSWDRAPGYETSRPSRAAHGDEVIVYVNDVVADALDAETRLDGWPVGSIVAKDGITDGEVCLVAAMEKRDDGWFWAEWDPEGDSIYSGAPDLCTGCHRIGDDWVRAFYLP